MSGRILSFVAGGLPLVTPIDHVDRVIEELQVHLLPFASPGLVGLIAVDEQALPLYDLDAYANDRGAEPRQGDFVLAVVLLCPQGRVAIRLDRLIGLPVDATPLPGANSALAELPERLQACIGGATLIEGLLAFFFAPDLFSEIVMCDRSEGGRREGAG